MGLNGENGLNWHKKEKNFGSIGGKVQKKLRKFTKHTEFNYHTGWIFFPKTIKARYTQSFL